VPVFLAGTSTATPTVRAERTPEQKAATAAKAAATRAATAAAKAAQAASQS
jgi:DNA topoisomerase-1